MSLSINPIAKTATQPLASMAGQATVPPYSATEPGDSFETGGVRKKAADPKYALVKGKNLTGAKVNDHFAIEWPINKGEPQTLSFPLNEYDLILGKDVKALPAKYKHHAVIVHKETGRVEIYEKTKTGPTYSLYNPQTQELTTQSGQPLLLPDGNDPAGKTEKKLNVDV